MEKIKLFKEKMQLLLAQYEKHFGKQAKLLLIITVLVGVTVSLEALSWFKHYSQDATFPRVLVAERDLEEGHILTQIDFGVESVAPPKPEGAVTDQDLHLVLGAKLLIGLKKGDAVTFDGLLLANKRKSLTSRIPKGMRAYSFEPSNSIPVRAGDYVDILLVREGRRESTMQLADGAEVLEVKNGGEKRSILVALSVDDLPVLEKARQLGKLIITLRNPEELEQAGKKRRHSRHSVSDLTGKGNIQIIAE